MHKVLFIELAMFSYPYGALEIRNVSFLNEPVSSVNNPTPHP